MSKAIFMDLTRCTACRGCQVACKQWKKLPAEKTKNWGSRQNPKDLSFITYKLVRFEEKMLGGRLRFLFFPDQCRHCVDAPCKLVADGYVEEAIRQDELTGAVLFTSRTAKLSEEERQEVLDACPYNIPRWNPQTGVMSKCDFCQDRIVNGYKPACVGVCPTGTMNFGDREDMMELAQVTLKKVKKEFPKAQIIDMDAVNVIVLSEDDPKNYYEYLMASANTPGVSRKSMLAKLFSPLRARA